jgi:acyl-CoA hydrolase
VNPVRFLNQTPIANVVARLRPGMTVYVPGIGGESLAFHAALQADPDAAAGVRFVGVHFPGINRCDYLGLHAQARQRAYFMQPSLRAGLRDERVELLPLDYPGIFQDLNQLPIDIAIAQVTPPDASGMCSLGPCADFLPAVWKNARVRVAHINPTLTAARSSFAVDASEIDVAFEAEAPVVQYESGALTTAQQRHASLIANLVRDGDTVECGIGKLPSAILAALRAHRRLRIHSGLVPSQVVDLVDCGAIHGEAAVQAGVALGNLDFYRRVGADETFFFRPVNETHDILRIAAIPQFCAINSAVEVDLFGQVNVDSINGRLVAGVGGLPAFVSGSRLSPLGRSIVALPATSENERHSRIVAAFGTRSVVALPRHEADYIVTEYGAAALHGLSMHERARALIAIAAPQFREELERAWHSIAERL